MPVTNLRFNVTSSWDGGGLRSAARTLGSVDRDTRRLNSSMGSGASGMSLWKKAALALTPALWTLGKASLALVGGLTTMVVAAGAAAAPWIGLAATAAANADKMGKAGERYQKATSGVKDAWMDLAKKTAPLTLGPMSDVLEGVAKAIPKLEPLVRKVAPVFADMGKSIRSWLEGNGFERFLKNVSDFGVPAFRNLVAAGKDFLATTGIGFRAFLPLAVDISEAIRKGAGNLRDWAEGGGFQRFLADVKQEWPTVRRFLGEAGTALGNIGRTLDGIGPAQVGGLATLLDKFNDLDIDSWQDFLIALAAVRVGGGLLSLLAGLANIRGGQMNIAGGAALGAAAAALAGAGATLLSAASALSAAAAALSGAGAAAAGGGLIGGLLGRLAGGSATFTITITPPDAADVLQRISDRLTALAGKTATATVTLNATGFTTAAQTVTTAWVSLRTAAATPVTFRAFAFPGNVITVAATLVAAWLRVRAASLVPVIFRATASPGNVVGVASTIVSAWARVRAAAATRPVFTARVNPGNVVGASASIVGAWRRVLSLPRSWSGSATARDGVSGPARAAAAAWRAILAMPRSVTFTVNIVTKKTGGATGGAAASIPPRFAGGGSPASRTGGLVRGPGGATSDKVPAWLSKKEWVMQNSAVKFWGHGVMEYMNSKGKRGTPPYGGTAGYTPPEGRKISTSASAGRGSGDVAVHFHGKVYAMGDQEFEDMVVHATSEAKRRKRL